MMSEFETRAIEHLRTRGVDPRVIELATLRLEPFGGAFLLRFDGAVVVSVREVHELLGAETPDHTIRTVGDIVPDANGQRLTMEFGFSPDTPDHMIGADK